MGKENKGLHSKRILWWRKRYLFEKLALEEDAIY